MNLAQIVTELSFKPQVVTDNHKEVAGCYIGDLLSWVMAKGQESQIWLTVMGNVNVIAVAKLVDFSAVVICEDAPLDPEAVNQAELNGVNVYTSSLPMYEVARKMGAILLCD